MKKVIKIIKKLFYNIFSILLFPIVFITTKNVIRNLEKSGFKLILNNELDNAIMELEAYKIYKKQEAKSYFYEPSFASNISSIKEPNNKSVIEKIDKVAIFGTLPPEDSGIASYNALTFGADKDFDVFSSFRNRQNMAKAESFLEKGYKDNFFPIESYEYFTNIRNYTKKIFVLGNSPHNVPYLYEAIKQKDKNNYLYLHEANCLGLLEAAYSTDEELFFENMTKCYKKEADNDKFQILSKSYIDENKLYGVRLILDLTGARNIIVNNNYCKEIILKEVKGTIFENELNIITAFHPIPDLKHTEGYKHNLLNTVLIGTFGIPNNKYKGTNTIIDAVSLLNSEYKIKSKLLIAGYMGKYKIPRSARSSVLIFDKPNDNDLFSLMKSVDIAIQLRNNPHGESSGCVAQLVGLEQRIIASEKFVDEKFQKYCKFVERNISSKNLAKEIANCLNEKIPDTTNAINEFSYKKLGDLVKSI